MLNFSKSRLDSDLQNKADVQYKVLCDWLRTIDNKLNKTNRSLAVMQSLLEDDSPPEGMEITNGDISDTESVR